MRFRLALFLFSCALAAHAAPRNYCAPEPAIRAELLKADSVVVTDPTAFDHNIEPFHLVRQRHPTDLFAQERYQDAVQQYGIEGHLRQLTQEYQTLSAEHPDDPMYSYLSARALIGRGTPAAITGLTEILAEHPDFAPAHRSLAEIYGSEAFHDAEKARSEREAFLARCPGATIAARPGSLPALSPLIDQAEQLLAAHGDTDRVLTMATQGVRDDEWRLQRIRPFDWYSTDFKLKAQRELQARYWRLWAIQVRCYRQAGEASKAAVQLNVMEQRAARLMDRTAPAYWEAQATLARLYIEGKQIPQAGTKLTTLSELLREHPDADHAARLDELKKMMERSRW
jgi:hypothetical protein